MHEDTEAWIEQEFSECSTIKELTKRYSEIRIKTDELLQTRIDELIEGLE